MPYLFGTENTGFDPATLENSKMIILWGSNISDTRLGCGMEFWVRRMKERGVPVIVIDPRKTRTVEHCGTDWIPIYPGTDAAMMCGVLYFLINENRLDTDFLTTFCTGFEEVRSYITGAADGVPKTPEWAGKICGIPEDTITSLARRFSELKPTALIPGLSIQRTVGGEEASRLAVILQAAAGNIGVTGGTSGGKMWNSLPSPSCGVVSVLDNENTRRIPVYPWAEWVINGKRAGYPADIKGIYNVGGNFCVQGSNIQQNIHAFESVDFSVCHELFLTATARYCDVVFPVTTFLERRDILFTGLNYLFYSERVIPPLDGTADDYMIFSLLSKKLGVETEFTEGRSADEWVEWCIADSDINDPAAFKESGIHDGGSHSRTAFVDFRNNPDAHRLNTPTGKIELSSSKYEGETGFPALPLLRFSTPAEGYPLRMITPHARFRVNSQNSNLDWNIRMEPQIIEIHPSDAAARDLQNGETVKVQSVEGELEIPIHITENIMPGVVSILQGGWPAASSGGLSNTGSPNFCTSAEPTMPSRGSRTHSVWVKIGKM